MQLYCLTNCVDDRIKLDILINFKKLKIIVNCNYIANYVVFIATLNLYGLSSARKLLLLQELSQKLTFI